jgi:hypothetical protein
MENDGLDIVYNGRILGISSIGHTADFFLRQKMSNMAINLGHIPIIA